MMQLKTRFAFGVSAISFLLGAFSTYMMLMLFNPLGLEKKEEIQNTNQFEIAEQKSVIREQPLIVCGGAACILTREITYIPSETVALKETIEEEKGPYVDIIDSLTDEEKELICRIVWREAANQGEEGQRAVIEVILNRVQSEDFPNTVVEVLSQPGQFSTWSGRNKVTADQIEEVLNVLDIVYNETESILTEDYLYFDGKKHSYATNYKKVNDHWFGTGLAANGDN